MYFYASSLFYFAPKINKKEETALAVEWGSFSWPEDSVFYLPSRDTELVFECPAENCGLVQVASGRQQIVMCRGCFSVVNLDLRAESLQVSGEVVSAIE